MWKILTLTAACLFILSLTDSPQDTGVNVWKKVSTDELNPGEILSLDMSKGYSACDGQYMYLIVRIVGSEEEVIVAFPNGGHWVAPEADPFLQAVQEEFDSLEDYFRELESKEIKKK